jgi:L-threonylcarbamoyladenylate synthase
MSELVSIERDGAEAAREALERTVGGGGVAIFPADGLYGLACDPADAGAIASIERLKGREPGKPSAVMYFSAEAMEPLYADLASLTRAAIAALLPGPVTLIVFNPQQHWPLACGENPLRLGLRRIEGPLAGAKSPVFQTSANPSGEPAPASLEAVEPGLREAVDLAIDGGELSGVPSTVVDLTAIEAGGAWTVVREGGMPYDELERRLTGLQLG